MWSTAERRLTLDFSMSNSSLKYRADIDGLRTLAVCSIVANHACFRHLNGGFIGVDVYSAISGY